MDPSGADSRLLGRLVGLQRWQKKKKKCLTNTRAAEEIMEAHSSWNQKVLKQT